MACQTPLSIIIWRFVVNGQFFWSYSTNASSIPGSILGPTLFPILINLPNTPFLLALFLCSWTWYYSSISVLIRKIESICSVAGWPMYCCRMESEWLDSFSSTETKLVCFDFYHDQYLPDISLVWDLSVFFQMLHLTISKDLLCNILKYEVILVSKSTLRSRRRLIAREVSDSY